ncbi:hypothetical protein PAAG_08329 [Paracoccidioides lutzii Pb01]|uniref:Uncharacterized protein n=1 Tax=Paracoccidioides lutzii (strain ATCC MYA-826 / Pb01) TaxID=502779 RepID=C1HC38_PARBA|nr:hypothetical protein PAAG_08329 [Paracoccidioides lutzii Pb01]EEH38602.2 hypothetical protein PAAG_08329 [Paracoccidioides lutzii Pb01]
MAIPRIPAQEALREFPVPNPIGSYSDIMKGSVDPTISQPPQCLIPESLSKLFPIDVSIVYRELRQVAE